MAASAEVLSFGARTEVRVLVPVPRASVRPSGAGEPRMDCESGGRQIGRAFGENQSGLAGLPLLCLDRPGSVSTSKLLSIRG
jgi:hypothetical protein